MKRGLGMHESEISEVFARWNKGVLDSFLVEITTDILKFNDDDGKPLVTKIMDSAGQKVQFAGSGCADWVLGNREVDRD
jgi:6-phosphogluconate dehydrogenase